MKRKMLIAAAFVAIVGCSQFATNVFRTEQVLTGAAYTSYVGYTNALANGTLKISSDESNAVKEARLKFAASVLSLDQWRRIYETNSAAKPQVQAALDALILNSSNFVFLVNYLLPKP
jgi:hypothetical protein